ncbi:MAG: polyprenyl synthetase family protein [Bacteroidetes bacterium]|nr:polyprenyl synthetase family protein [Bacteroidota bacterium]
MQVATRDTPTIRPRSLAEIKQPVEDELAEFKRYFRDAMRSEVRILDLVTQYLFRQKGKRIRPVLVLLSAKACGSINESTFRAAALVELLHTATLVHDDVVDDADKRRSMYSVKALWKNRIAVLIGDFLLSKGLLLALEYEDYDLLQVVSGAVRRMSEGELLQIEKARKLDIDEETYFKIISDKTASLISACTACGAVSVTDDPSVIERMRLFGEKLGLAFQIRDDLFDYGEKDVGKPLGLDIEDKKMTLPLIYALQAADPAERRKILKLVRKSKKGKSEIRQISEFVKSKGGLDYARGKMNTLAEQASEMLGDLNHSEARDALESLVTYTVSRGR